MVLATPTDVIDVFVCIFAPLGVAGTVLSQHILPLSARQRLLWTKHLCFATVDFHTLSVSDTLVSTQHRSTLILH